MAALLKKNSSSFACLRGVVAHVRMYKTASSPPCFGYYSLKPSVHEKETSVELENKAHHANVLRLIEAYRHHGHKKATVDPLNLSAVPTPELDLKRFRLEELVDKVFPLAGLVSFPGETELPLKNIVEFLERRYTGSLAAEFDNLPDDERRWFAKQFESRKASPPLTAEEKRSVFLRLQECEVFDTFLQTRYAHIKRYGAEGAESLVVFADEVFRRAASHKIENIVMSMPHRGRLNFMTGVLQYSKAAMLHKINGKSELPPGTKGHGDVLSHLYTSVDLSYASHPVHVNLLPNPSHLEAGNPVAVGKARANQTLLHGTKYANKQSLAGDHVLCFQVHGDAAFAGQGVVAETQTLAHLPHYTVGGSLHLIVNNQIGFTTPPERARSARYATDIAKMTQSPVLRVNGDDPEEVVAASRLALAYREAFKKDVFVDLICYRRRGHNELDDPSFTQPHMYKAIDSRASVVKNYGSRLIEEGVMTKEEIEASRTAFWSVMDAAEKHSRSYVPPATHLKGRWAHLHQPGNTKSTIATGVPEETLREVGLASVALPQGMAIHARLKKGHVDARVKQMSDGSVDWATAEALAMGTLLKENFGVRFSGQDVGRGTFSHRHMMLVDQATDAPYVPLNSLGKGTAMLEVCNSNLSELGVVGFEYGYSLGAPNTLVVWEAQFGDFFNCAQTMFDTFVASGESKWLLQSGLVILLPHGFDGTGPEHSSARIERWLQLTDSRISGVDGDDVNMYVAHPTTPAQYFHLLRRQMLLPFRKPLVVFSPKTLLRLPAAKSSLASMGPSSSFAPVLDDTLPSKEKVKKVVLLSGKVYYEVAKERKTRDDIAFIRVEELAPFPAREIAAMVASYPNKKEVVWYQEEPENNGPWHYVAPRLEAALGHKVAYIGRPAHPSVAVGIPERHAVEVKALYKELFA